MRLCLKRKRRRRKRNDGTAAPEDGPIEDDPVKLDYVERQVSGEVSIYLYLSGRKLFSSTWDFSTEGLFTKSWGDSSRC